MMHNKHKLIGTTLGNCKIEQLIGRGGYAAVFLATQESLRRPVAVKVLLPQVDMSGHVYENFLARFEREAGVIAQFTHINIMQIYDYGKQDGLAYLVMPYYAGGSLHDLLSQLGSLSLHQTLTYLEQAASALDYAHQQGVIHRDIKPANFLLANDGRLVLADFGIAHLIRSITGTTLTGTGSILGTPEYMAPEMVRGQAVDLRADIYEMGIVLFQMLSGTTPFHGGNPYTTMMMHLTESIPLLHHTRPAIPAAVDNVIQQATMKDPQQRFRSAGELAQALRRAVNGRPPHINTATVNSLAPQRDRDSHYAPTVLPYIVPAHAHYTMPASSEATTASDPTIQAQLPPIPSYSPTRPTPSKRLTPSFILLLFLLLVVVGASIICAITIPKPPPPLTAQTPTVAVTPTLSPEQVQAQNTVQQSYDKLNSRQYYDAYLMNTNDPKREGYCTFIAGYQSTEHNDITFDGAPHLEQGHYVVPITIHAHEVVNSTTKVSTYWENVYVAQGNGTWKIVGGQDIKRALGTATPLTFSGQTLNDQAQALVQQYYAYISQRDYPAAYNLLSLGMQASQQFCDFIDRYAKTTRADITSISATAQLDGTVRVDATIKEDTGGTTPNTYPWSSTVEQTNNILDIKSVSAL